jgi:hypothetical protein
MSAFALPAEASAATTTSDASFFMTEPPSIETIHK